MSTPLGTEVISISLVPLTVPAGTVVDHITVTVTGSAAGNTTPVSQSVPAGTTSVTFTSLPADTYTATAQAFPATGAGLGTPATGSFTITEPFTVTVQVPGALSFQQTA